MPQLTTILLSLQGIVGVINGASSLLFRSLAAKNAEAMQTNAAATDAISLGAVSVGAFYLNAAYRNDVSVVWYMVLGRAIALFVFRRHGGMWENVAIFEGVCGVSLVVGRGWDIWRRKRENGIEAGEKQKEN